jgi:hypothetical protein
MRHLDVESLSGVDQLDVALGERVGGDEGLAVSVSSSLLRRLIGFLAQPSTPPSVKKPMPETAFWSFAGLRLRGSSAPLASVSAGSGVPMRR